MKRSLAREAQAPAPVAESSGARLALCPFCGRRPVLTVRPDNAEATSYFAAVACFCDGYAACAHKDATAAEADEAERLVREKWNRRATASPAVVDGEADAGTAAWAAAKRLANKSEQDFVRGAQWAMQREASKTVTVSKPDARIRAKAQPPVQGSEK